MRKAEKFIEDNARNCSNELVAVESKYVKEVISYHEWLTPDQAKKSVERAREEIYHWLMNNLSHYAACDSFLEKHRLLKDLKQAMKDE